MRNLKRALSLALASVMLLGMMVVGTSAASYPDVDENDNVEAIEVLNAVNVMIGDRGNFRPDAAVNRHEMATIMAKLVLGVETADNYVGTHPFTDVFPWADKYVAACYENGLVAGTSATTFGGNQPLTAVQAAAMMLRALGYKDLSVGAKDWRAPVTAMANQIRLFDGVASNPSEQLTRNQVAQLALNTLKSPMVNLKDNTISWSNDEGQIIMTGGSREYIALSSNEAYAKAINDTERAGTSASQISGFTVELGEHLYNGKLKLNNNYLDVFGRPARHWEFDGKEIGSYIKEELMVMDNVGKVTGNDLYSLLGASTIKDYDTLVTIDGVANDRSDAKDILGYPNGAYFDEADMNRNNKAAVGKTGTGVLTQVFVDHEKDEVYVAVINTYLARADRDYDDKSEEATLTVYGIDEYRTEKEYVKDQGNSETMKVQAEDFTGLETIKKDDPFLVTVADGEIQTMVEDEVLEGVTLTAFKKGDHVVSDGTEYAYTTTATYDSATLDNYTGIDGKTNLKDISYNIYLDAYGNLIGIKEIDAVKNYVFLAGIDVDGSNLYSKTATANALFLDGTTKTIKINLAKSKWTTHPALNNTNVVISGDALLNTWCTYTVSSDNVYTVTEAYATRVNPDHPGLKDVTPKTINANPNNYPGGGENKTKLAQSWQPAAGLNEDNYTVDVKRMRLHGTTNNSDGSAYANVYGDSTSVYLTANLDELFNDQPDLNKGYNYGIIKDVDAVTTGVADVSIKVMTKKDAQDAADDAGKLTSRTVGDCAYGIYTLYDSDGIVIASVVIGEDDGVKDLVYVHTDTLDLESYNSTDDIWTWTRRVVFNGQETTLTEKDSELSELKEMLQFHWYEIKRNSDGNVISVVPAYSALYNASTEKNAFVHEYEMINTTVEATSKDTVLYQTEDGPLPADDNGAVTGHDHYGFYKEKLNVIGTNTLAVETLSGSGIHFRDNVNVVLQYWNRNTEQTEIETGTGVDRLKSMVDFVNKNTETRDSAHPYYLSAVIEKGFATTIVIYDSFNSYNRPEAELGTYELTLGGVLNSIYTTSANLNSDVYLVDANGNITYVESNDDVATSTVNGYKRYTIPYDRTVRIYDNDVGDKDFLPFFSPVWAVVSELAHYNGADTYHIGRDVRTNRYYLEFSIDNQLTDNKLTVRERLSTDPIYVGVLADSKTTVTINGKAWSAKDNCFVASGRMFTVKTDKGAKVYINGSATPLVPDAGTTDTYTIDARMYDEYIIISTEAGSVTPPTTYTVTVAETANGSASVDKSTGLEGGETITVTATPAEGYELDTISVDGTAIEGNTFTMPEKDVTVTVTFKASGSVSITVPVGRANVLIDGKKVESVSKGDVISLDPAEALVAKGGVTDNGDGTYTVTGDFSIEAKDATYSWNAFFSQWFKLNDDGSQSLVAPKNQWTVASVAASLKRFSLARAGETEADRKPIDTTNPNWFFAYINDPTKTFEIDVTITRADNTTTTVTFVGKVENATLSLKAAEGTPAADASQAWGEMGTEGSNTGAFEPGESDTKVTNVYVDITSNVATFTQYVPEGQTPKGELTAAEIEALLKEKTGVEYKVADVAAGKATATGNPDITFTNPTPTQVWKITYPGNTEGVLTASTKEVTGVAAGNLWLIPEGKDFAATGSHVVNGKATLAVVNSKDTNYVAAVELQGTIAAGAVGAGATALTVYIPTGTTPSLAKLASATHKYIRVGAELQFERGTTATGIVGLSANGTVVGTTSDTVKTGKFTVANNANGTLTLAAEANAVSNNTKVYLDGKEVSYKTANGDKYAVLENVAGYTILYKDTTDNTYKTAGSVDAGQASMGNLEIAVKSIAQGISADASRIDLYTGYTVTKKTSSPAGTGDWTPYKSLKSAQDGVSADEVTVVPANTTKAERTIYVKGFTAELLTMDDPDVAAEVKELSGRQAMQSGETAATAKFIYELEVTKNIGSDDIALFGSFETTTSTPAVAVTDKTDATAAINKDTVTVAVTDWFTFADGVKEKTVLDAATTKVSKIVGKTANDKTLLASGNTLTASAFTISKHTTNKDKLDVAIESAAKRATAAETYTVTFEVNGVPYPVDVTFSAHTLTAVEAAQNVTAVIKEVVGLSSLAGTDAAEKSVAPVVMTASVAGNTVTLTANPVTIKESTENTNMVKSWYSAGTKDDTVIAIMVTCPDGAKGLKATGGADQTEGGKVIDLTARGVKESDGKSLIMPVLITEADLTAGTKTITLTWFTDTSCTDEKEMGDTVTYTFDLSNVEWVPAE